MNERIFEIKKVKKIVESKETEALAECIGELLKKSISIGEGNNADVFIAPETSFEKVCLKLIKEKPWMICNDIDTEHLFQSKALEAGVKTPLSLISFESNNRKYLVMQIINGSSVKEIINGEKELPENFNHEIFFKSLDEQVKMLHDAGIYHRDLHGGNVMIDENGMPVIIDFGTATQGSGSDETYREEVEIYNPIKKRYEYTQNIFIDDFVNINSLRKELKPR